MKSWKVLVLLLYPRKHGLWASNIGIGLLFRNAEPLAPSQPTAPDVHFNKSHRACVCIIRSESFSIKGILSFGRSLIRVSKEASFNKDHHNNLGRKYNNLGFLVVTLKSISVENGLQCTYNLSDL